MSKFYQAQTEGRKLRLNLYGPIGNNPLSGKGITSAWVAEQIISSGKIDQIDVYINSPGGDVFEGIAIYNELKQFPGQVNVFIMGLAASIASVIAMAGDQRVIYDGAEFMIHQASGMTFGTADDHVKQASTLRRLDAKLATIYAEATGGDAATIAAMMTEETWMESEDALTDGFATHGSPQTAIAPPVSAMALLDQYQHVPLKVAAWQASGDTPTPSPEPTAMEDKPEETEVTNEEPIEEEDTIASLKAKIEELEAKIAELMPEEEEQPSEAQAIAKAFAHDKAFAVDMISQGKSLDDAYRAYAAHAQASLSAMANKLEASNDGVNPVAVVSQDATDDNTDPALLPVFKAAKRMKNDIGRAAYLRDRGIEQDTYTAWLESNG